jgi:hypothetical protein
LRHSPPAITPMAQPQNRVSRRRIAQVFCPRGLLFLAKQCRRLSTLRTDRSLCRSTGDPEPPECGLAIPPAGTAPRSASLACRPDKRPLVSEVWLK